MLELEQITLYSHKMDSLIFFSGSMPLSCSLLKLDLLTVAQTHYLPVEKVEREYFPVLKFLVNNSFFSIHWELSICFSNNFVLQKNGNAKRNALECIRIFFYRETALHVNMSRDNWKQLPQPLFSMLFYSYFQQNGQKQES